MADDSPTTPKASQQAHPQGQGGPSFRLNVQNEPPAISEVLEATAAPVRGFARPGRRGASGGSSRSSNERRAAGSLSPIPAASAAGVMSPLLSPGGGAGERTPRPTSPSGNGTGTGTGSRGSSPLTVSSRSQSVLRAPHPFDEDPSLSIEGEGVVPSTDDPEIYARMFTAMQSKHETELKALQENILGLESEVAKLGKKEVDQERYIIWANDHTSNLERQVEQLGKENRILVDQVRAGQRSVRDLEIEIRRRDSEARVYIRDREGEEPLSPGSANERFRQLREEIRDLKEERYAQNEEMEVLFEKKERYEELQEEHQTLKETVKTLEHELEVVREKAATPRIAQGGLKRVSTAASTSSTGVGEGDKRMSTMSSTGGIGGFEPKELMRTETELEGIANLGQLIIEKDESIMRLGQRIQDKDEHIAKLEKSIAAKEEQITKLKVDVRKATDQNGALAEEVESKKEGYEKGLERARQQVGQLEQKLAAREEALAQEKERHDAVESRLASDKRDLQARLEEADESDRKEFEDLAREVQEKEDEIAKLKQERQELEQKREEMAEQNRNLQQTARTVRKWQWDQPILQTISNTQLWSEKNIMKNALESIKNRVKRIEPEQLEQAAQLIGDAKKSLEALPGDDKARQALVQQLDDVQQVLETRIQPLRDITQEVNATKDRLRKEKDDWAKEDAEITAVLRRIEGRGGAREHRRRHSEHIAPPTEFMKRIDKFEEEQNTYITTKHDEYAAIQKERPLGAPLTPEEDKRLHALTREFVNRLPENPMLAFLSGETPQARRRNQLWALTEKVKRLKIREKGKGQQQQDIHAWLPKLKPSTMEHKRRHALLVKELHGLEGQVEDLVQEINELTAPPDIEQEEVQRGRSFSRDDTSSSPLPHAQSSSGKKPAPQKNPDKMRRKEEELRKKEDALRREIRFAHARLERLLYNRQLFEHWTENLEKRLNSEAAALVTQVLLEFELQTILDKESKEACFCSLLEYFFPRAYDFTVRGTGTVAKHGHGRDHGTTRRKLGPVVAEKEGGETTPGQPQSGKALPKSAVPLGLGRSETLDLDTSKKSPGQLPEHKGHKHGWHRRKRVTTPAKEDDDEEAIKRSRAPPESLRARFSQDDPAAPGSSQLERASTIYEGGAGPSTANPFKRRSVTFEGQDKDITTIRDQHHGHGGGHVTISPTAQWLRENAYPVFCQVMTSLIWFVLLLAIQPVNLFWTFSFILTSAVGLPFYLLQAFRFLLVEKKKTSRDLLEKSRRTDDDASEEKVVKDQWQSPAGGVDVFEGTPLEGPGLGILQPRAMSGDVGESSSSAGPGTSSLKGKGKEPDLGLRGGAGRPPKWRMKEGLTVQEQYEYDSGSDDRPEVEDEERLRSPSPAQGELPGPFVTVQKKGKAREYVVSDVENSDEEGYGSKRRPKELDEPQQTRPTPETSPSRSRKGKDKEELTPQQLEEIRQASRRGRDTEQGTTSETQQRSRNKRTLSEEARWNTEQMLANALARKQEEDEAKLARRRQWLWWRVWYWVMHVLASAWQLIASRWPSSLWRRKSKAATEGPTRPPPQPSSARTPLREGSPSWWDRWSATSASARSTPPTKPASGGGDVPDITVTTATPIEPRGKDGPPEDQKSSDTKPRFWSQWLASLRSFIDTLVVQKIPLLSFTVKSFLQSSLTTLKSLLGRLLSLPKQLFSSISTNLGPLLARLLAVPKRLFSSIVPSGTFLQTVLNYPSRALQSMRSKVREVHVPRLPQLPSVPQLRNKVNLGLPTLPKIKISWPKFVPPRPPSPPTILGSLLSLLIIYTLLTYLAVVAERRVWTSSDTTWRHAYLRDLELSRGPPISVSQQQQKVGHLASFFSSSPTPQRLDVYVNTAYPGWSPLKADYRLIYAPLWYKIFYLPSDFVSGASHKTSQAWSWAGDTAQQTWDWLTSITQDGIPRSPDQARDLAAHIWSETKGIFTTRIIHVDRVGAVEVPSRISQLPGWIQRRVKYSLDTVHQQRREIKGFFEQVFVDRTILVPGGSEGAVVEVPSFLTTWRRKVGYYLADTYDTYIFGLARWYVASFASEEVVDTAWEWKTYFSSLFTRLAEWWEKMEDLEGRFWDFLGRKVPGVGVLDFWATHLGVRTGEILGGIWEAVKGTALWVFGGPVRVVDWVSDVLWKFQIMGTVLARRHVYPWGAWFEGVWRTVQGYVLRMGEVIGVR